ncbi:3-(3-hydroxy-phenyl)propionate/3-hydroxycinnamic acid hydroxylase [Acidocella aquatica]|uniref:3-(3-hydroxy-phenyl)propionate/3-hydroxycinnamic acid hydroxylase n=1 Tax=Acidocella aquatica TaxID=1922313 RepID=A0ABQ6A533_9PROT|nr:bifunctional 3-(3-hydroxy-phenyl)propionate/3-hydroxycinnamic acid hydroxylase [Acidocella aquatica]GLR66956.1 3-(3-hydroxy-phenyl)propionate/3-hydroxycinnamic acid hydroxylase [Acidocella aquatica]
MSHQADIADLVVVGAGPVGLLLANYVAGHDLKVVVVERLPQLIDYPRGVGMDDECLRAFQAAGLAEAVLPHTTPDQWMRFVNGRGTVFASIEPKTRVFGWPRRNAFIQPLVDKVLAEGLGRYPSAQLLLGHTVNAFTQDNDGVDIEAEDANGAKRTIRARYVVGCDGGRSLVRKALDISFEGNTDSNRWIVVDLANDPSGSPNAYLHANPARPFVSIALPHGVRRYEFLLFPGEGQGDDVPREILESMMAKVVPDPKNIDLIRARVYTHNARLASTFRKGRVLLAGDAAHIMPVWQGQGYNSGIRDAANLGWKLVSVLTGIAGGGLLDTYESERRPHAAAMIKLSETVGKILAVRNPVGVAVRDTMIWIANLFPPVKRYFLEMRFKPMPRYERGVVTFGGVQNGKASAVGRMFIQPMVTKASGETVKLDDVIGVKFALICWGSRPDRWMSAGTVRILERIGTEIICAVPMVQQAHEVPLYNGITVLGDKSGDLKEWFGQHDEAVVLLRPDRFVAGACAPQRIDAMVAEVAETMSYLQPLPGAAAAVPRVAVVNRA